MRAIIKSFLIIISSLAFFLTYTCTYPSLAAPDEQERLLLHQSITGLQSDAGALAQELLVLDIKLQKAAKKKELLEKELSSAEESRSQAQLQYNKALEDQQLALKKIKPWLNFQYRFGYWNLLDGILGSSSLAELISRTSMVSIMLGRQSQAYRAAESTGEAYLRKKRSLQESVDRLAGQNLQLEAQIEEINNLAGLHRDSLDRIKGTSEELARKVSDIENRLLHSLDLYTLLTGDLAKIPWANIEPDRISFGLDGITLEMSEGSFNRALQSTGDADLKNLSVNLRQGSFTLQGKGNNITATAFTLAGALVPDPQSDMVRLELKALNLDGIPVTNEVLGEMSAGAVLQMPLPEEMKPLKVAKINITDNNFVILLKK